jgi:FkbH-like protein
MVEPVRLVIWDLDETFWKGTLTEGGVRADQHAGNIVVALAKRGILSSVCSKNDFDQAKDLLKQLDVWDYFVFPSIDWTPKGPRVAAIVEAAQLRAETVLFVDDNPLDLQEARHFTPSLQIADQAIVARILDDDRFMGKPDESLARLASYRILEEKQRAGLGGRRCAWVSARQLHYRRIRP